MGRGEKKRVYIESIINNNFKVLGIIVLIIIIMLCKYNLCIFLIYTKYNIVYVPKLYIFSYCND